jgi:hypothetical protein
MYMYMCLYAKSWVFHGIQVNTPAAAHDQYLLRDARRGRRLRRRAGWGRRLWRLGRVRRYRRARSGDGGLDDGRDGSTAGTAAATAWTASSWAAALVKS